jgi:enamine deaminase RidA (YjgF/YER057c/UK114 family)
MNIDRIKPTDLFPGTPYDYAAVAPAGRLVFTAGACPLDVDGRLVCPGDLTGQTRRAMANLFAVLDASGSAPDRVLKTTVFVATSERSDLVEAWEIVKSSFAGTEPPSTLVGVSLLGYPDQLVEVEAVAVA